MKFIPSALFPKLNVNDIDKVQMRARRYATATILMIAVGLIYMAASLVLIFGLIRDQNGTCVSRQQSRTGIRTAFAADPDWTDARQAVLDLKLPAVVHC